MNDILLILDYHSKYTEDIAEKLRLEGIACRILPGDALPSEIQAISLLALYLQAALERTSTVYRR